MAKNGKSQACFATASGWRRGKDVTAFTLIELLVVVSIIALLISILLPSLQSAREQAKTISCQANNKSYATALASYTTESNGWLPGSPGTTGAELLTDLGSIDPYAEEFPSGSRDWRPNATQTWDWAGPLSAFTMDMDFTGIRPEMMREIAEELFVCPSNRNLAVPFHGVVGEHGNFRTQKMFSYNSVRNFLMWPRTTAGSGFDQGSMWGPGPGGPFPGETSMDQLGGNTRIPRSYRPIVDRVGGASEKIFIADGSRYTAEGVVDFDIAWSGSAGGAFSNGGATLPSEFLRSYWLKRPENRYSYRHGKPMKPGLTAAFYDGHAEYVSEDKSRLPLYWWPKNTLIPRNDMNARTASKLIGLFDERNNYIVRR